MKDKAKSYKYRVFKKRKEGACRACGHHKGYTDISQYNIYASKHEYICNHCKAQEGVLNAST